MAETDATASFAMDLGITGAEDARSAADALEILNKKIEADTDAIGGMQKALRLLKGDTVGNAASITALKDKITAQRAAVAAATSKYVQLGGTFKKAKPEIAGNSKALDALKGSIQATNSPLSGLLNGFSKLSTLVGGGVMAAGLIGIGLAVVALAAAYVAGAVALTRFGLVAADSRRSEALQLEGLTKLRFGWMGLYGGYQRAADKASFLQSTIDQVSGSVSIGRDQVAGYTEQLYKMGYRAGNLQAALEGISVAASGGGETAAQQFLAMADNARFAGGSVRKLADTMKARFGEIVARKMLSLDVQTKKLKENLSFLFSGVKIEKFLAGLNKVTELFSANTESGKALKEIITTIFDPFFDMSGDAGEAFANFIKGAELQAMNLIIALFPLRKWLHETFGDKSLWHKMDFTNGLIKGGQLALVMLAGAAAGAVLPFALLGLAVYGLGQAFLFMGEGLWIIAKALGKAAVWAYDGGKNIVKGIADGIGAGAQWAVDAIGGLARKMMGKFRTMFDMHSPSRVMRKDGRNVAKGAELGVEDGTPDIVRAVGRARPDFTGAADVEGAAAQAKAAPSVGPTYNIQNLNLHSAKEVPAEMAKDFASQLLHELHVASVQMGNS